MISKTLKNRPTYDSMKLRDISTLSLCRVLEEIGIDISKRTLQHHLDHEFMTTTDDRLKRVAKAMVRNYDKLIEDLKKVV